MKFFPLLIIPALLFSCSSDRQSNSEVAEPSESTVNVDKSIDSTAFELLVNTIEDPDRKDWQNPDLVIEKIGELEDKTVADIGAGTGYFTFRLAPLAGKVIAIDIDERFLDVIDSRKSDLSPEVSERIETRLSLPENPLLRESEADVVLIVNTYHFLSDRIDYLQKVKVGMAPGGTILLVDFKNDDMEVAPPGGLVVPQETAIEELKKCGFQNLTVDQLSLKYQYIIKANS